MYFIIRIRNINKMEVLTFEQLNKITSEARKENYTKSVERISKGRTDAVKHITEGCVQKMIKASESGQDKAILYSFQWIEDPKEVFDANGVKTIFEGNVRLLDLMNKGKREFIQELNTFFNKDDKSKYHCGFFKSKDNDTNIESWNIFVSWSQYDPHRTPNGEHDGVQYGGRGNGSGRGRGNGREGGREGGRESGRGNGRGRGREGGRGNGREGGREGVRGSGLDHNQDHSSEKIYDHFDIKGNDDRRGRGFQNSNLSRNVKL